MEEDQQLSITFELLDMNDDLTTATSDFQVSLSIDTTLGMIYNL